MGTNESQSVGEAVAHRRQVVAIPVHAPGRAAIAAWLVGLDVAPILAEKMDESDPPRWLSRRILEVELAVGALPSVAVFVDDPPVIDPLAAAIRELLKPHNISGMGYKDCLVVGGVREVRILDIRHVKGMEFEAAFFVGLDEMAARHPDLFHRFVYVGLTRAATYLGITYVGCLPQLLEPLRNQFAVESWDDVRRPSNLHVYCSNRDPYVAHRFVSRKTAVQV